MIDYISSLLPEGWRVERAFDDREIYFIECVGHGAVTVDMKKRFAALGYYSYSNKKISAAKRQGNRRGVCDVVLPARSADGQHCGLYLELKREKGGRLSDEQEAFLAGVITEGYQGVVARGHREAIDQIKHYLGIDVVRKPS